MALQLTPVPNFLNNPSPFAYMTAANQQSMQNALNTQQFQQNQTNLANLPAKNAADLAEMQGRANQENATAQYSGVNALSAYAQALANLPPSQWGVLSDFAKKLGINAPALGGGQTVPGNGAITNPGQVSSIANNSLQNSGNLPTLPQSPSQQQAVGSQTAGVPQTISPNQVSPLITGPGNINPNLPYKSNVAIQQAAGIEAAKDELDRKNKLMDTLRQNAQTGQQIIDLNNQKQQDYNNSTYKGAFYGSYPSMGTKDNPNAAYPLLALASKQNKDLAAEQATDKLTTQSAMMVAKNFVQGAGGRLNMMDLTSALQSVANRSMEPATFQQVNQTQTAAAKRAQDLLDFGTALNGAGLNSDTISDMLNNYQRQRPIVDSQGNLQPQNIGSWKDFYNQDALNSVSQGNNYTPEPRNLSAAPGQKTISENYYQNAVQEALQHHKTKQDVDKWMAQNNWRIGNG